MKNAYLIHYRSEIISTKSHNNFPTKHETQRLLSIEIKKLC